MTSRRSLFIIAAAGMGVLVYVLSARSTSGSFGFPLDDSWIHQTYGRNLAQTGQWEYVSGIPSAGSTSPFFTILLALGYLLHVPFFAWTYALGAAVLALAGLIAARLADRVFPDLRGAGLWTGLAIVVAWHLIWAAASGMETMLFGMLSLLLMLLAWREMDAPPERRFQRGLIFGIVGAILIATRPEGVLLVALLVLMRLAANLQPNRLPWFGGALIGGLMGVAPYALLNYSLNGTVLPNTFSAKQAENAPLLAQPFIVNLWAMLEPLTAGGQIFLVPGMIWAAMKLSRQRWEYLSLLIWPIMLILLYTLRLPAYYQHGRYVIPSLPPLLVIGVGGTISLLILARRRLRVWARVSVITVAITALALFVIFWFRGALIFGDDVARINSDMVAAAHWLAENVTPVQLLAVHDIGAAGYFAPRPIFDLAGLVSPEVVPIIRDAPALMTMMEKKGVAYLMVLPSQRPAPADDARLCELFNANGGMGGMTIYKLAWDGHCPKR